MSILRMTISMTMRRRCDSEVRQTNDSYLSDGRLAKQDKLDTAARLGWHSGRVCHDDMRL